MIAGRFTNSGLAHQHESETDVDYFMKLEDFDCNSSSIAEFHLRDHFLSGLVESFIDCFLDSNGREKVRNQSLEKVDVIL